MNLGKLSGIKGLVSNSHGKRRFKGDLSADMISPPLGDFRHTMHVGRGGDVFGDTSFLSNHGGAGGGDPDSSPEKAYGFFSRTLRHVRRTPARPEGGPPQALSPPPPPISPIIKNAISLPRLDVDTPNGCVKRELFPSSPSCPESSTLSYGVESGFATLPRLSRIERQQQDSPEPCSPPPHRSSLSEDDVRAPTRSDSMTSFTVDLGPSLMSEVLGMIDGPDCSLKASLVSQEEGLPATDDPQSKLAHSPFREGLNGGESLGRDWEKQENARPLKKATPEVATISSSRVESVMEAESFQRAADVIARHYGGNGTLRGQRQIECGDQQHFRPGPDPIRHTQKRAPYPYTEEEEEIKV